jgi:PTH2 family peptidyl-tRNA hydrolase
VKSYIGYRKSAKQIREWVKFKNKFKNGSRISLRSNIPRTAFYATLDTHDDFQTFLNFFFREKMVVVKGESTQHLKDLHLMAEDLELPSFLVKDAGITQVASGAVTVFGVFGEDDDVNKITGRLKLL